MSEKQDPPREERWSIWVFLTLMILTAVIVSATGLTS